MSAPLVVGLGEGLLRLSPPGHRRLEDVTRFEVEVGGAELNALIGLARWGARARWVTRLADNALGRRIAAHAVRHGVETTIDWDAHARAPVYFVEHGVDPRPTRVLYDRADSAMSTLSRGVFDWNVQLAEADAVLCSGITCGLGPSSPAAVREMFSCARQRGVGTFFDVNHRTRLWSWKQAAPVLRELLGDVDVLLASSHDLQRLLDADSDPIELARHAIEIYGHDLVVMRENSHLGDRVKVTVTVVSADAVVLGGPHEAQVIDGFGGGDIALGVFVSRLLAGDEASAAADLAANACALQHTIPGDAWIASPEELADGDRRRIHR